MNLTVYTSNSCPNCTMLKDYLTLKNVPYTEKNISDPENRKELLSLGYLQVPVTKCNITNTCVVGFNTQALKDLGVE